MALPGILPWTDQDIDLYHGTLDVHASSVLSSVNVTIGRRLKDFGRGFYTTTSLAFDRIKLAAGDMNADGRGDVVMYARHEDGSPGTELRTYLSNGSALVGTLWLDDPALDWSTVKPY